MDLTKEKFHLVDKILYKAFGEDNQEFGEYEVDYVFLCKLATKDVEYEIVKEEISEVEWVAKSELKNWITFKKETQKC
jgi:isopentenyldiphosphate isomerase